MAPVKPKATTPAKTSAVDPKTSTDAKEESKTNNVEDKKPEAEIALQQCKTSAEWTQKLVTHYRATVEDDLKYLDAHPEIPQLINLLVQEIEKQKPKDIYRFAGLFFQHNRHTIIKKYGKDNNS